MKRFEFRLARLERLRDVRRKEARRALAEALAAADERRRRRESAELRLDEAWHTAPEGDASLDPWAMKQFASWRAELGRRVRDAEEAEALAGEAVERALAVHGEAARSHRVLERLRTKRHRQWLQGVELEERKFLDETHQLRVARERGDRKREKEA